MPLNDAMEREALLTASNRYIQWISQLGESEKTADGSMLKSLCAPEIKRIFNKQLYAKNNDEFVADLLRFKEGFEQWKIHLVDIIIAPKSQAAVLYYDISIKGLGNFTTISILHFNEDHLIREIDEVFSRSLGFNPFLNDKEVGN